MYVSACGVRDCVDLCGENGPCLVLCGSVWWEWSTFSIMRICVVGVVHV